MKYDLMSVNNHCYPCQAMPILFKNFWRSQAHSSSARTRGQPKYDKDYTQVYNDDDFLSNVALSLMASFRRDTKDQWCVVFHFPCTKYFNLFAWIKVIEQQVIQYGSAGKPFPTP